jgi:N-acetylmuramoyl-L-alanine amidase
MNIIPRATWKAEHGVGSVLKGPVPRVVIHHSYKPALKPSATVAEETKAVHGIERFHTVTNGWSGIGYSFLVAPSGRVYEGRGWGRQGAHAGPVNSTSIGVCLLIDGNVTAPNQATIDAVRELIAEGVRLGHLSSAYSVTGHRDHMAGRSCPGDKVYERLEEFRHDRAPSGAPEPGTRRWSDYLGEHVIVTAYESDGAWRFIRESELKEMGQPAASRFSEMPPAKR